MKKTTWKGILIRWLIILGITLWLAAKMAMAWDHGISFATWQENFIATLKQPFDLVSNEMTAVFLLIAVLICCGVWASSLLYTGKWRHGAEHGSADWGNVHHLKRKYEQDNRRKNSKGEIIYDQNIILSENLSIGINAKEHGKNLNVTVIGGAGSGKSTMLVMPNLMQCNSSFVVVDPSGELYKMCGGLLQKRGYVVKCFNLVDMDASDRFNPFSEEYIFDEQDIKKNATSFAENTEDKQKTGGDPFWTDSMKLLLEALISFLWEAAPPRQRTFAYLTKLARQGELTSDEQGAKSTLDFIFEEHGRENPEAFSWKQYQMFMQAPPKTRASISITLCSRLGAFNIPAVAKLTSEDELELSKMGDRKTALFCIIPQAETSYNFLVGMMYTALFGSLYRRGEQRGKERQDGSVELDIPVQVYMDEFANSARPNLFPNILATSRKYLISIMVYLQNMSQIRNIYEKEWEDILGNCDTLIYLGGNEKSTWKYISESLGKATINIQTAGRSGSNLNTNLQLSGRELMTPDEVRVMDNKKCLVIIRGEPPIIDNKYNLMNHPNIKCTLRGGAPPFSQEFNHEDDETLNVLENLMIDFEYKDSGIKNYSDLEDETN